MNDDKVKTITFDDQKQIDEAKEAVERLKKELPDVKPKEKK